MKSISVKVLYFIKIIALLSKFKGKIIKIKNKRGEGGLALPYKLLPLRYNSLSMVKFPISFGMLPANLSGNNNKYRRHL